MTPDALARFVSKVAAPDVRGCRNWTGTRNKWGYGYFWLNGKMRRAHKVAWETVNGPVPDGALIMHRCDNPACVNPDHLSLGSQQDNNDDMQRKGRNRQPQGERHGSARLTADDVQIIRRSQEQSSVLARQFGVSYYTVRKIRLGLKWRHI